MFCGGDMSRTGDSQSKDQWAAWHGFHYLCDTTRWQKIVARMELVRKVRDIPGDIVDAGAYKGSSTLQFAHLLNIYQPNSRSRVIAFDTFDAVFPRVRGDEAQAAVDHMESYESSAFDQLTDAVEELGLASRIGIVRGDITDTLPKFLAGNPGMRISLLHCDLDVYPPTLATLQAAWQRLVIGGIAVFDEYAVEKWGESDAVDEFFGEMANPPKLKMLDTSPTPTAYCTKAHH
jgi:hypothetical protein